MNQVVATWNAYSNYNFNIPVYYSSGIPTAQSNYMGSIGFGGQGNYRAAMHESSHWFGTGTARIHRVSATRDVWELEEERGLGAGGTVSGGGR